MSVYVLSVVLPVAGQKCTDLATFGATREHLVTTPSRHTRWFRWEEVRLRGDTWWEPKEPSKPTWNSLRVLA